MSSDAEAAQQAPPHTTQARDLLRLCRPKQWIKNLLLLMAPLAAGVIQHPGVLLRLLVAFVAFVLASCAVYVVNDLKDVELDRVHPSKRARPLASGAVSMTAARRMAPALVAAAVVAGLLDGWQVAVVVTVYIAASLLYCFRMKHEVVLDLVFVLSGFLLRAIGGGVAAGVPLSQWFLLTAGLGALFVVAGKRYAERVLAERSGVWARPVLREYSLSYLRFVWTAAAAALLVVYSLWTFTITPGNQASSWGLLSTIPFLVVVLRYAVIVDRGGAGEPEDIVIADRMLLGSAVVMLALLTVAIYS
ncbi:MAG: decaprenyl-phosphate phosphoribosyltransferase [Actinomycetota bacterium]|nr:decaprenyl-phosphate phosphoribosyltransferase [Actinomycetota bacterium]